MQTYQFLTLHFGLCSSIIHLLGSPLKYLRIFPIGWRALMTNYLSQCKYSLTSGEFRFQNPIFSSRTLSNYMDDISWICVFRAKKMPLFLLVKNILGVFINWGVTIPIVNFHDLSQLSLLWQEILHLWFTYISDGYSSAEKKKKHENEAWKLKNGYWCVGVGYTKSCICHHLMFFTDQKCLWHPYSSLWNALQWSWSSWTHGKNRDVWPEECDCSPL